MKKILLAISVLVGLSIAYYFSVSLPTYNQRRLALEERKYFDAQQEKREQRAAAATKEEELAANASYKEMRLQGCLSLAGDQYWEHIKLNGTKTPGKPGAYSAPTYVVDQARKIKKDAIDECHQQYGK
jgi:hypothetical protein